MTKIHQGQSPECWSNLSQLGFEYFSRSSSEPIKRKLKKKEEIIIYSNPNSEAITSLRKENSVLEYSNMLNPSKYN